MKVSGILVPFARAQDDSAGLWWNRSTDFALDMFNPIPILLHHGLRGLVRLGTFGKFELRDNGLWAEGEVEGEDAKALLDSGRAAWSSGTLPHLMKVDAGGYVRSWPLIEGSLLAVEHAGARGGLTSAQYVRCGIDVDFEGVSVRSSWLQLPGSMPFHRQDEPAREERSDERDDGQEFRGTFSGRVSGGRPAMRSLPPESNPSPVAPVQPIRVASRYDRISLLGMLFHDEANMVMRSRSRSWRYKRTDEFMRALANKVQDQWVIDSAIKLKPTVLGGLLVNLLGVRAIDQEAYDTWHKTLPYLRADEAMTSTLTAKGDELIPDMLASVLHYYVRLESRVLGLLEGFAQPTAVYEIPTITSGPTFHTVGEIEDQDNFTVSDSLVPTSTIGTGKVKFETKKLAALTLYSRELVEDAGVDFSQAAANEYIMKMAAAIDDVLINGDPATGNGNISNKGASLATNHRYKVLSGLRKLCPAEDQKAIGTLADDGILDIQALMGPRGILGRDMPNLVCVIPPETAYKLESLDSFASMDQIGDAALLLRGQLGAWRGVPIIVSEQMMLAGSDGLIDHTVANNTKGTFLVLHRQIPKVGFRRSPEIEQSRVAGVDGNFISASLRISHNVLESGSVGYGYNITV